MIPGQEILFIFIYIKRKSIVYLQPSLSNRFVIVEKVHPVVIRHFLPRVDCVTCHQHHAVPFPVLDGVGETGVIEEGHACVDCGTH